MASEPPDVLGNRLLTGAFGSFQRSAAAGADTATVWTNLRQTVGAWQLSIQGAAQPYDPAATLAAGTAILSAQGVNAANVSTFRGLAGQWLQASQRLANLEPGQQITASEIFVPPWAVTANASVPDRYRVRTQWQFESAAGDVFNQWRSDEIQGPLTSTADALSQAPAPANTYPPQAVLNNAGPPTLLGFQIEQI